MTKFRVLTCRYLLILDRCTIKHTLMAFLMFCRLDRTMLSRRLNRTISCTSTVFMLCLYEVGYFLRAASVSKFGGILDRMSCATSSTTSSVDFPPPDEALAYINNQLDYYSYERYIKFYESFYFKKFSLKNFLI